MPHKTSAPIHLLLACFLSSTVSPVSAAESALTCETVDCSAASLAPGAENTGKVTVDPDLPGQPRLQFDGDADGPHDDGPPQAEAMLGPYRGHDRIIYWSEQH